MKKKKKKKPTYNNMSVTGHLDELRFRILKCIFALLAATIISFIFSKHIVSILKFPGLGIIDQFILIKPAEIIAVYFKVSLYTGFILSLPFILFQIWQYVKPALSEFSNINLGIWSLTASILFACGTAFAFYVVAPNALSFLISLSNETALPMLTLDFYVSFIIAIMLLGGMIFEIPVFAGLLTSLGVINPAIMRRNRKLVIFILLIIAAILTPTTDIFNMLLFAIPMILLFETGIILSWVIFRIKQKNNPTGEAYEKQY